MTALWTGILAGPLAWLALLQFNYSFSYVACESREKWFLHVAALVAATLVAGAGAWAWRAGHGPLEVAQHLTPPATAETCVTRWTWMSYTAALSSAWFLIVILAMEVPASVVQACQ